MSQIGANEGDRNGEAGRRLGLDVAWLEGIFRLLDRRDGRHLPYTLPTDRSVLTPQGLSSCL
jgi:hypothetical protein